MKTKELIRLLQEEDPSGEEEVCVGNEDIYVVEKKEAYWDGCLQVLKHDESKGEYYSIVGGEFRSKGYKISIRTVPLDNVVMDHAINGIPCEITYDSEYTERRYKNAVKRWREDALEAKKSFNIVAKNDNPHPPCAVKERDQ
jgi:hypothetical protein